MDMNSATKARLTANDIGRIVKQGFGSRSSIESCEELKEGFFNSAYAVTLDNGTQLVLKVSSSPGTRVLRYEEGIMETEVQVLRLLANAEVPVPKVYVYDNTRKLVPNDYFFMQKLEGTPLSRLRGSLTEEQNAYIDQEIGKQIRKINAIKGPAFGDYYRKSRQSGSWTEAFDRMISDILADGTELGVTLPYGYDDIHRLFKTFYPFLDAVKEPCLVHLDAWDGNVFVNERLEITGIIDCERALWGDALMEFNFGTLAFNEHFAEGYGKSVLTPDEQCRRLLYDIYFFLVAAIEVTNRQYEDKGQEEWAHTYLVQLIARLKEFDL